MSMLSRTPSLSMTLALSLWVTTSLGGSSAWSVQPLSVPVPPGSSAPSLSGPTDGPLVLSWVEKLPDRRHALRYSRLENGTWSPVMTAAEGLEWSINWAEKPAVTALGGNRLAAHWFIANADSVYTYDIRIALSGDGGRSWSTPVTPHRDGTPTQHGFVSILPWQNEGLIAVWLDARRSAGTGREDDVGLRYAQLDRNGRVIDSAELDERTCSCCRTSAAITEAGLLVAYRDRSMKEIRDISLVRLENNQWSQPQPVASDGWFMPACPINGPALASRGQGAALVWFHAAQGRPRVQIAFSTDAGRSFGEAMVLDEGGAQGYVDVVLLDDGSAIASWIGAASGAGPGLVLQRIWSDGRRDKTVTVTNLSNGRAAGFPRIARHQGHLYVAWRAPGASGGVRVARVRLDNEH